MALLGGLLIILGLPLAISYALADQPRPRARLRLAALLFVAGIAIILIDVIR